MKKNNVMNNSATVAEYYVETSLKVVSAMPGLAIRAAWKMIDQTYDGVKSVSETNMSKDIQALGKKIVPSGKAISSKLEKKADSIRKMRDASSVLDQE